MKKILYLDLKTGMLPCGSLFMKYQRSIALWGFSKKSPLSIVKNAHPSGGSIPNWITSVAACRYTDLIASGSSDGLIKLWRAKTFEANLAPVLSIPMVVYYLFILISVGWFC